MILAPCDLPDDAESLRAIIAAQAFVLAAQTIQLQSHHLLIEKLKTQLAILRRGRFGQSSEKIDRTEPPWVCRRPNSSSQAANVRSFICA